MPTAVEPLDLDGLRHWVGRIETREDIITPWAANAMAASLRKLDANWQVGHELPPLWHWAYCLPTVPQDQLGPDGHPASGGLLPPAPLPRRMWAGSQLQFLEPMRLGDAVSKTSRIASVEEKHGKTGRLIFVQVEHELYSNQGVLLVRELQDLVYREAASQGKSAAPIKPPGGEVWAVTQRPDETLLFRYSALTFNSHRIHYDYPYTTQVESYAGLVVHGPLIATFLLEALQQQHPSRKVERYSFKAVSPLICNRPLRLCGHAPEHDGKVTLWAEDENSHLLMQASAYLA